MQRDGRDRLVEQRQPFGDVAEVDQAAALTGAGQRGQLGGTEPFPDLHRLREGGVRGHHLTLQHGPQSGQVPQVALLDALPFVQQPPGAVGPPAATREVALVDETEREPERAPHRARRVTGGQLEGTDPRADALGVVAGEERGLGEQHEVVGPVGAGQGPVRDRPVPP